MNLPHFSENNNQSLDTSRMKRIHMFQDLSYKSNIKLSKTLKKVVTANELVNTQFTKTTTNFQSLIVSVKINSHSNLIIKFNTTKQ